MIVKIKKCSKVTSCILLVMLIILAMFTMLGCSSQSDNTQSQSSSTTTGTANTLTPQDIKIVDKWAKSNVEYSNLSIYYVLLENPNNDCYASDIRVSITFKDTEGVVLDTETKSVYYLFAGQKTAVAGSFDCLGKEVSTVEVTATVNSKSWTKQETAGDANTIFPISNLNLTSNQFSGYALTGEVENKTEVDVTYGGVTAVFKNSSGEIIDAQTSYIESLPVGGKSAFKVTTDYKTTDVVTYDVYFMPR